MIPDEVRIEPGLFGRIGDALAPFARDGRIVVVSDENVWAAQRARLDFGALEAVPVLVAPGEGSKSWAGLAALIDRLLEAGVERSDHVVALGGGVVGDLAGFAAAVLKRGCGVVQAPTSLLAMVDSAVGGKTGIDVAAGKNLVGAFHPPAAVLVDPDCLDTLPEREVRAGYAEVVKYGLIGDAGFFAWCEGNGAALLAGQRDARVHAIRTSVAAKAAIVAQDPRETTGRRALLNLGHTFGHAIEAETDYGVLHGEAVALGMALAFRLSAELGLCPRADAERVAAHLAEAGLPVRLGEAGLASGAALVRHMRHDKKAAGGRVRFVLARGIGEAFLAEEVDLARVERFLDAQG